MKKLAFVITQAEMGGAQKSILILCTHLKEQYDITVYSAPDGGLIDELKTIGVKHISVVDMVREINPVRDWKAYKFLIAEFKKNKYDIVHCHSSKAGILARQAAKAARIKKVVFTAHGFVFNEPMSNLKKKFYTFSEKFEAANCDTIICVDKNDIEIGKKHGIVPKQNYAYIPNGIDFDENDNASRRINSTKTFTFGFVANFYETKGHRYLIESFNEFSRSAAIDSKLILVGDGALRPEMEALAKGNENIEFFGYRKDGMEIMKSFDCFIMSSVKEGFPFVILEAIKNRVPVISTNVGAVSEILNNGELGLIVPPFNSQELTNAMGYIINHQEESIIKADKAYELCRDRFSTENMVKLTTKVYES